MKSEINIDKENGLITVNPEVGEVIKIDLFKAAKTLQYLSENGAIQDIKKLNQLVDLHTEEALAFEYLYAAKISNVLHDIDFENCAPELVNSEYFYGESFVFDTLYRLIGMIKRKELVLTEEFKIKSNPPYFLEISDNECDFIVNRQFFKIFYIEKPIEYLYDLLHNSQTSFIKLSLSGQTMFTKDIEITKENNKLKIQWQI